jgi:carboxylate-amine ligase
VDRAARREGCRIISSGTHPLAGAATKVTDKDRYRKLARRFARIALEQVVCGCHVHVGLDDQDLAICVMNRVRPWLSTILALAVNSPYWNGLDTGYDSFRTAIWSRWPSSGPPPVFRDRAEYDERMQALIDVDVLADKGMIYWDVRPSQQFGTLEFRVSDACLTVEDTVMVAGLVRALTRTCAVQEAQGVPPTLAAPELLRAAQWRAARSGCRGDLVDVTTARPVPTRTHVRALMKFLQPALDEFGDWDTVSGSVERTLAEGTGADRQRAFVASSGSLLKLMRYLIEQTTAHQIARR